jgi:uncharacterized protein (DUF58 family)
MNEKRKTTEFLSPGQLGRVRNLSLRAKLIVEGYMAGLHKSPYHGFSVEFLEYRSYMPGESIKRIDWRKFAKSDKSVVKLFEDETNLIGHILVDKSASMKFSSLPSMNKYDYARTLAASIAWLLIGQRDAVGLAAFDTSVKTYIPPRSTNVQLTTILGQLDRLEASEQTQCGFALNTLAQLLSKRGMSIVLSDLLDEPRTIIQGLRHLRFKKQDIIVLWIRDPAEKDFSSHASLSVHDMETGEDIRLDGYTASEFIRGGMEEHEKTLRRACNDLQIDFEPISTAEPFQKALQRVLQKRKNTV